MSQVQLLVIAKAPVSGRSKTRLCPPCSPEQAADLARAALQDTLTAVLATPASRRLLVLEGEPGPWLPDGLEVVPQGGGGLDERLASAFEDAMNSSPDPALLIGMDTPQVNAEILSACTAALMAPGVDAVLGEAFDGGFWAVGLRTSDRFVFEGVPMSAADTAARQRDRLRMLGRSVRELPRLRDVDFMEDAAAVAAIAPSSRFAAMLFATVGAAV